MFDCNLENIDNFNELINKRCAFFIGICRRFYGLLHMKTLRRDWHHLEQFLASLRQRYFSQAQMDFIPKSHCSILVCMLLVSKRFARLFSDTNHDCHCYQIGSFQGHQTRNTYLQMSIFAFVFSQPTHQLRTFFPIFAICYSLEHWHCQFLW